MTIAHHDYKKKRISSPLSINLLYIKSFPFSSFIDHLKRYLSSLMDLTIIVNSFSTNPNIRSPRLAAPRQYRRTTRPISAHYQYSYHHHQLYSDPHT